MAPRTTGLGEINHYAVFSRCQTDPGPAWLLGPQVWGKLTTTQFYLGVKQNPGPAWLLGPQAWGKLTTTQFYLCVK